LTYHLILNCDCWIRRHNRHPFITRGRLVITGEEELFHDILEYRGNRQHDWIDTV
jgi:hypothetical protein